MESTTPGIGQAFNDGIEGFKKNPIMAIVGTLIFFAIDFVGLVVPFLNILFAAFVMPPLIGGYMLFFLKFAKGEEPSIDDLFAGFKDYTNYLGAFWLLIFYVFLYGLAGIILAILGFLVFKAFAVCLIIIGYFAFLVLVMIFVLKWSFVYTIIADGWNDGGVKPAFDKSVKITQGRLVELFLVALVIGLFTAAGSIVLGIGMLVTAPIGAIGFASYYLRLKKLYLEKAGAATPAPGPLTPSP